LVVRPSQEKKYTHQKKHQFSSFVHIALSIMETMRTSVHNTKGEIMKRIVAGLVGSVVFGLMISGAAFASGDERYEHGGYGYGSGYMYNDDVYEHGRARIALPSYGNVLPTAPAVVYPNANISSYPSAVRYNGHEAYEYSGRYGYNDDDRYEYRGGYREHD
jgi:hypothetical protein